MTSVYKSTQNSDPNFDRREQLNGGEKIQNLPSPDVAELTSAIDALKMELDKAGRLKSAEVEERLLEVQDFSQQVEKFTAAVEQKLQGNGVGTQQEFKNLRQQVSAIASVIRKAPDLDSLLKVTVTEVREKCQSDRALIYRFDADSKGVVVAESLKRGWTPALHESLPTIAFGLDEPQEYLIQQVVAMSDIDNANITPYQRQLLEQFQVKASLNLPIMVDAQAWGLLVLQQCSEPRQWQEAEISLLEQICTQLTVSLQQVEFRSQLQEQIEKERAVTKVVEKIRQSLDQDAIFKTITQEIRNLLKVDRVAVYKFAPNWSGEFIVESVGGNWTRLVGPGIKTVWEDTHLQETQGGRYRYHETFAVDDVYKAGHSPCHVDILEQFEVKAYVIAPIFVGEKLWGLLGVYQNSGSRHWQKSEVKWIEQIAGQLWVALRQADTLKQLQAQSEQLAKATERERAAAKVIDRLRKSLDLDSIFKTTTLDVRLLLKADRVGVYRFNEDWSGEFVLESVSAEWTPLLEKQANLKGLQANQSDCQAVQNLGIGRRRLADTYLQDTDGGRFRNKGIFAVEDIYEAGFSPCYMEVLEESQVRAYAIVPVFQGEKLWGLLAAYQNSGPRQWEEAEIALLAQIGDQLGVALQQAEYLQQLKAQSQKLAESAERDRTLTKVIQRIRQSLDLDTIFKTTTQEVRNLIKVDRVAIYKFRPDYFGDFIAESEAPGEPKLVGPDRHTAWEDPYLNEHQGGRFRNNEVLVVDDVYNGGLTDCHVEALEGFHVKACIVVAIFKGQELWGLLSAFQNKQPRHWEQYEVDLLLQVAAQIGVALQQTEYLQQLQAQSQKLAESAERDRTVTKVIDRIRKSFDLETIFRTTTQEVRQLLKVDRVAIYKFRPDYFGDFIAESEAPGEPKLAGPDRKTAWEDPYLNEHKGGRFRNNEVLVVDDVYNSGLTDCHVEALEVFHVKACIVVAIFKGQKLWGLLSAFQNKHSRHWEQYEVDLLLQVAAQIGVAIQQAEYLQQLQVQSQQLAEAAEKDKAAKELLQQRALQLLRAVRPALDGDLTVRAPITEDELGTIADAYNNTLQALRKIVIQVQTAAQQVAQTSTSSDASIIGLTSLAQQQFQEISQALERIQKMVKSTEAVVANAQLVEMAVQQANQTVESGDTAMNRTVEKIQVIRETVDQTGKKIKRLSESSQKISRVVSLLSNFATQTNVLALNATIEATRAGEYGKGFAVVADEVRSLSRQSAAATTEIEKLVQEIQAETGEVATAMETGIQQVVEGTNLVNETRQSLNAIVAATAQISQLVEGITQATQVQMHQSASVTEAMTGVAQISNQTSVESSQISASFKDLLGMAQELLTSSGKFKVN
jgi:methyl-accepting chemotaxis protein PixJ